MSSNSYGLVTVKVLISAQTSGVIGNNSIQVLCQRFDGGLDIYTVGETLKDVIKEDDMVLVDPKNEIIKVIRNTTKERITNIYKAWQEKLAMQQSRKTEGIG